LLYIAMTLVNKLNVHQHFAKELDRQHIKCTELSTSPTLFNNFLWAGIALNEDSVWLGEYSILQKRSEVKFVSFARNLDAVKNYPDKHSTEVLQWFSQGKYFAAQSGDTLKFYNVKWGRNDFRKTDPDHAIVFNHYLFRDKNGLQSGIRQPRMSKGELFSAIGALWHRMFDAGDW
jgi:hypothetical protein